VLLLHGFPDSWRLWRRQLAALAKAGHWAIAPDLRGFGKTVRPGLPIPRNAQSARTSPLAGGRRRPLSRCGLPI